MNKNLPKVYVQKQSKIINNNKKFYYTNGINNTYYDDYIVKMNVIKKLNIIFNKYAYKYNLLIKTKDGESNEIIILKTKDYLLTIENKVIMINNILDVKEI